MMYRKCAWREQPSLLKLFILFVCINLNSCIETKLTIINILVLSLLEKGRFVFTQSYDVILILSAKRH